MRCKYIFLLFYIFTSLYLFYKVKHILKSVDPETGFFYSNNLAMVFLFLTVIVIALFAFLSIVLRRCPLKYPQISLPLSVASAVMFFALIVDTVTAIPNMQSAIGILPVLFSLASLAFCVFLVVYSLMYPLNFKINKYLYITPLIFWLIKLVSEYIKTAKMALISENGTKILACAFVALFFLYFAKYQCRIVTAYSHKILMFLGFSSFCFCETFAIPQLVYYLKNGQITVNGNSIVRNSVFELLFFVFTGLFIIVYLHSFFSNKNLSKRHHGSHTLNLLPVENETAESESDK